MKGKYIKWLVVIAVLSLLLVSAVLFSLTVGEMRVSLAEACRILFSSAEGSSVEHMLVSQVRLPRILLGVAVGGALSLAGVILQGIYRNPLVEPYTMGISGGASLGVSIVIVLGLHLQVGRFMLPLSGFAGALAVIFLVYAFSAGRGGVRIQKMLLTGVMISFVASSGMMFLMAVSSVENLHGIVFWTMGSLNEPDMGLVVFTLCVSFTGLVSSYFFVRPLNALRLGEEKAMHLGINTGVAVRVLFVIASLMAGVCVAVAGVIGFVGLVIPHLLRLFTGTDHRILLAGSFLTGSAFLVLSDVAARTVISPNELPIGVITGIIGGIAFIVLMSSKKM